MIDPNLFLLFLPGAVALGFMPGADMTFVLVQSVSRGPKAGIAASLGIFAGALVHMTAAAFGLSALFAAAPLAFDIVRYAGAVYLVWIAFNMIRNPPHLAAQADPAASTRKAFRQGFLTNLMNPKVALFFIAFLPQFVSPTAGPAWIQILILGITFNCIGTGANIAVSFGGGSIAARLRDNPLISKLIAWLAGSILIGLAVKLAWPDRK